jgi:hypothetical protein
MIVLGVIGKILLFVSNGVVGIERGVVGAPASSIRYPVVAVNLVVSTGG